jgi:uncharacterized membrane protein
MEEIVKVMTVVLGSVIEGLAAVIVAHGIIKAVVIYIRHTISDTANYVNIRVGLGKMLALSLELLLAADIVRTAVAPTWEDIGKLTAIAALRTLLNYFLERELSRDNGFDGYNDRSTGVPIEP